MGRVWVKSAALASLMMSNVTVWDGALISPSASTIGGMERWIWRTEKSDRDLHSLLHCT
jgi:hypothetical protein